MEQAAGPAPDARRWPHFDPPNILWYFGAITAAFFSAAQLSEIPRSERGLWVLLSALAWIAVYLLVASLLRKRGWWIPGGLAVAVAVGLVPIVVYAFEVLVGVWPQDVPVEGAGPRGGLLAIALVTALAGLAAFALLRFPFLLFVTAFAVLISTQDTVFLGRDAANERAWAFIGTGGALVLVGLLVDRAGLRSDAFWAHVVGFLGLTIGLLYFVFSGSVVGESNEGAWTAILLLGAFILLVAPLIERATWAAYGVLGLYAGALHFLDRALGDSVLALPLVALSVALVGFGILVARVPDWNYARAISTRVRRR
jgi:hypothetical protein